MTEQTHTKPNGARQWSRGATLTALLSIAMIIASGFRSETHYRYFRVGNPLEAISSGVRPGFALVGGGKDLDDAFAWLCDHAAGGDFLILRASGDDTYNSYVNQLCKLNSVATLLIPNREAAAIPFVIQAIRNAEAIFISGGDQANYINFWRDTPVQSALNDAIKRGVLLGGTSAGLAIQGEFAYTAQNDPPEGPDLGSRETLADPFHFRVTLVRGFLIVPPLAATITDSHFSARDRLGRLLVFMARMIESRAVKTVRGIGVDEHTAVLLDPDGKAQVVGTGSVYFLSAAGSPSICKTGVPLTFDGVAVRKLRARARFDLQRWSGDGTSYTLSVNSGKIVSSQPNGAVY